MKRMIKDFNLKDVGFLEMIIASYPILAGYAFGPVLLSLLILLLIVVYIYLKEKTIRQIEYRPYKILVTYILFHLLIWMVVVEAPSRIYVNNSISITIFLLTLPIIARQVNHHKLVCSIYVVSFICLIGLLYHVSVVAGGGQVSQIKVPFLPESSGGRLAEIGVRPKSFFAEPAAYSEYMIVPLFCALKEKKYLWAIIIAFSIFLSTSTNGLVLVFIMTISFVFFSNVGKLARFMVVVCAAVLTWGLFDYAIFNAGLEKFAFETENTETNARLAQGIELVKNMDGTDYILGVPYESAWDFYSKKKIYSDWIVEYGDGSIKTIYTSTFWGILLLYGLVGLSMYLMVLLRLMKLRDLLPFILCICAKLFTDPTFFNAYYVFQMTFVFSYVQQYYPSYLKDGNTTPMVEENEVIPQTES